MDSYVCQLKHLTGQWTHNTSSPPHPTNYRAWHGYKVLVKSKSHWYTYVCFPFFRVNWTLGFVFVYINLDRDWKKGKISCMYFTCVNLAGGCQITVYGSWHSSCFMSTLMYRQPASAITFFIIYFGLQDTKPPPCPLPLTKQGGSIHCYEIVLLCML